MNEKVVAITKLDKVKKQVQQFLADSTNGELLYLIAMSCFLSDSAMGITMFDWHGWYESMLGKIGNICLISKLLFFDRYSKKQLGLGALLLLNGFLISQSSGYRDVTSWAIIFLMAKDVDFTKLLKVQVLIVSSVLLVAFAGAMLGLIPNLQYINYGAETVRNAFGIFYPTDFAGMVFFAMLGYLYLDRENLHWVKLVICAGLAITIFRYCHTRLDCSCMMLAIVGFACLSWQPKHRWQDKGYPHISWLTKYGIWAMPIMALAIFLLSYFYSANNSVMADLNGLLSKRLILGHQGLMQYAWKAFGQAVHMNGNGGGLAPLDDIAYFFLDCSYINFFLRYGFVFTLALIGIHMACCKKYQDDKFFVLCIVLVALNGVVAHHLIEPVYNIFPFALVCKRHKDWFSV